MIKVLITKSLLACLREPMEPDQLTATAAAWGELLGNVPTEQLNACYQEAWVLPDHKPGFPVTADELLVAWAARKRRIPQPTPRNPQLEELERRRAERRRQQQEAG